MSELARLEEETLIAVAVLHLFEQKADRDGVDFVGWGLFEREQGELGREAEGLVAKGLLRQEDGIFSLTEEGKEAEKVVDEAFVKEAYDEGWEASAQSEAMAEFSERVYGRNLSQTNFADMEQLDGLIEALGLDSEDRVLDLGCGTGMISEYISARTGASVTGLDFSTKAICVARERCREKADRLSFVEGDMNDLDLPEASFDAIVSIDTLYFAGDLAKTVGDLKGTIKPEGCMGILYTASVRPGESRNLLPESCVLGKALEANGLVFQVCDCTESLRGVLKRMRDTAVEMKDAFEEEGLRRKYFFSYVEGEDGLKVLEDGRGVRYQFIARGPS